MRLRSKKAANRGPGKIFACIGGALVQKSRFMLV
ncbi:hypothetical protein CH1034_300070 [Klebsiella pneumoniae]|nr:hypothetical protein CH1034_300070 [Klebsiella pneumoniae]